MRVNPTKRFIKLINGRLEKSLCRTTSGSSLSTTYTLAAGKCSDNANEQTRLRHYATDGTRESHWSSEEAFNWGGGEGVNL
jgi:hypothetical protein